MNPKKILFVAYLYPPAGGKALPGVQRTVKFVRYLTQMKKYVLTLKSERYPDFFSTDNSTPLPVSDERVVRIRAFDMFQVMLNLRSRFVGSVTGASVPDEIEPVPPQPAKTDGGIVKGIFTSIKDMVSEMVRFPDYAYGWILPAMRNGRRLIRREQIDVIFATGMPWSGLIVGWGVKRLTGAKFVADFRDPWVDNPYATDKSIIIKRLERSFEKWIVVDADIVSLNTDALREAFLKRYPYQPPEKFITMPNGYDAADFHSAALDSGTGRNSIQLTLSHAGSLYGLRDPKPILDAIARLAKEVPGGVADKIQMIQMGYTDLAYCPTDYARENGISGNYTDLGPLPYAKCLQKMSDTDILIIIQQGTMTQIPSKLYEYIYLNKPVLTIGPKKGALNRMILDYDFGEIFDADDIDGIKNYLKRYMEKKQSNVDITAHYEHRDAFDVKNIAARLEEILINLQV